MTAFVAKGHEVVSADNLLGGKEENVNPDWEFVKADLIRRQEVKPLVKGVDLIFHLAAYAAEVQSMFSPISINEINLVPMNNLFVEAVNNNVSDSSSHRRPNLIDARRIYDSQEFTDVKFQGVGLGTINAERAALHRTRRS